MREIKFKMNCLPWFSNFLIWKDYAQEMPLYIYTMMWWLHKVFKLKSENSFSHTVNRTVHIHFSHLFNRTHHNNYIIVVLTFKALERAIGVIKWNILFDYFNHKCSCFNLILWGINISLNVKYLEWFHWHFFLITVHISQNIFVIKIFPRIENKFLTVSIMLVCAVLVWSASWFSRYMYGICRLVTPGPPAFTHPRDRYAHNNVLVWWSYSKLVSDKKRETVCVFSEELFDLLLFNNREHSLE